MARRWGCWGLGFRGQADAEMPTRFGACPLRACWSVPAQRVGSFVSEWIQGHGMTHRSTAALPLQLSSRP